MSVLCHKDQYLVFAVLVYINDLPDCLEKSIGDTIACLHFVHGHNNGIPLAASYFSLAAIKAEDKMFSTYTYLIPVAIDNGCFCPSAQFFLKLQLPVSISEASVTAGAAALLAEQRKHQANEIMAQVLHS
ncbi:hypothetical protein EMCRGX_G009865 [Ephydatia muelleri]